MTRKQIAELIGGHIEIVAVTFKEGKFGKDYGIFEATLDGDEISFVCGAKVIMGMMFKYLGSLGIRIERDVRIELPEPIGVTLIEKVSQDGKVWIDYE